MADAAAIARRIVEEVLSCQDGPDGIDDGATERPSGALGRSAGPAPGTQDREPQVVDAVPAEPPPGAVSVPPRGRSGHADHGGTESDAAVVARRIVDEVLAGGSHLAERAGPGSEIGVRGVPPEGMTADERTVRITPPTPSASVETDEPAGQEAAAEAAEIVRRIVAEARRGHEAAEDADRAEDTPSAPSPARRGHEAAEDADRAEDTPPTPSGDTLLLGGDEGAATAAPAPGPAHPAPEPVPAASTTPPAPDGPGTGPEAGLDPAQTSVAKRLGTGERELIGSAPPALRELEVAEPETEPAAPPTLRWLVASLIGAVALAVLLPLAVAALRTLVALD